uniref:P/Homo B domain-containing protein n=1 Tax=Romanomermis culicivorax TaxID=13658 RepID=A0A915I652_ROMCU
MFAKRNRSVRGVDFFAILSLFAFVCHLCRATIDQNDTSKKVICDHKNQIFDDCFTDRVVVKVKLDQVENLEHIAAEHDLVLLGQVGTLENIFSLIHKGGPQHPTVFQSVLGNSSFDSAHLQYPKQRKRIRIDKFDGNQQMQISYNMTISRHSRRPINKHEGKCYWPDPYYCNRKQWHLLDAEKHEDGGYLRVEEAWKRGYSGKGVVVSILDDGIQRDHPDLAPNYDPEASTDINSNDSDPIPVHNGLNDHGTRCAGEVAAVAGNDRCGVGIAYNSRIGGVRMLDGNVTDEVEAKSLSLNPQHIDIYSASWGPSDNGDVVDGPGPLAKIAFEEGIRKGRGGKGNIFVWASGDGGKYHDSCSCDGYLTSIYTISVSAVTKFHKPPHYLEECPSTLTSTYSSDTKENYGIVTTDLLGCTDEHTGTSASAPMGAGVIALVLEANRNLTWRDVQHLIVRTSNSTPLLQNSGWIANGADSHKFGYGLMDAGALVKMAEKWINVPAAYNCSIPYKLDKHKSFLLNKRPHDKDHKEGFQEWPFMSVQQWGEKVEGRWTLIAENADRFHTAFLTNLSLVLCGTAEPIPYDSVAKDAQSVVFDSCHQECDLKHGCYTPHSNEQCVKCKALQYPTVHNVRKFLVRCLNSCPDGFYAENDQKCVLCESNCKQCSNKTQCTQCQNGFYLLDNLCLKTCPEDYLNIADKGICLKVENFAQTFKRRLLQRKVTSSIVIKHFNKNRL